MLARLLKAGEAAELVGYFVASGTGATGLTVTIDVWRRQPAGAWTEIVTAASATQIGDGGYEYQLAGASVTAGASYFYVFKTAGTADQKHVAGYCACETDYTTTRAGYLDAAITSRLASASYTAPPSAATISTTVWAEATRTLSSFGTLTTDTATAVWAAGTRTLTSMSALAAEIASAVWGALIATYNSGTAFGGWLQTQLDATTSSRLASSALVVRSSTAQAGAASTITLDASASATNDLYNGQVVVITGGTGAGQARLITDYVGSTKVATVARSWATNPASNSTYTLLALDDLGAMSTASGLYSSGTLGYLIGTIGDGNFTVVSATADAGDIVLYKDDDYSGTNAAIALSVTNARSLTVTSARIETIKDSIALGVTTGSGSTLVFSLNPTMATVNALDSGQRECRIIGTNADGDHTLAVGSLTVKAALI